MSIIIFNEEEAASASFVNETILATTFEDEDAALSENVGTAVDGGD